MGLCVSSFSEKAKANNLVMPASPDHKHKSMAAVGQLPTMGDDVPTDQPSQRHPYSAVTVHDHESKEEAFFDSRPWLNSDSEDDFASVNGDFTPSRGSTPVHPSFGRQNPSLTKFLIEEKTMALNSENCQMEKKKRLFELFRDSVRSTRLDVDELNLLSNEQSATTIKTKERKRNSTQCCIPRLFI